MQKLSQKDINKIVASHFIWRNKLSGGKRADFANIDLSDKSLMSAHLKGVSFKGGRIL